MAALQTCCCAALGQKFASNTPQLLLSKSSFRNINTMRTAWKKPFTWYGQLMYCDTTVFNVSGYNCLQIITEVESERV